jgi:RNA-binding protein YlmH
MVKQMTEKQKRFEELAHRSNERGYAVYSDFLGLSEISELCAVRFSAPINLWGGYENAERCIACFGDREYFTDNNDYPIKCILIKPVNQKFADNLTHRDFLGSLMGLGIRREVLGDIIISENCGYLFCLDTISEYIIDNLTQVRHTTVKCELTEKIPTDVLPQPENREIIVSSERLDVIVSAIYKMSRSQVLPLFNTEKVFVNGAVRTSPSATANVNDKVSVRGFGRFIYRGVLHTTKKDRLVIGVEVF